MLLVTTYFGNNGLLLPVITVGRRLAAALLPRLFWKNPRSYHKGATGRVRTGDQRLPVLCHCQLGQDTPYPCQTSPISNNEPIITHYY